MDVLQHLENRQAEREEILYHFSIEIEDNPVKIYFRPPNVAEEIKIKSDVNYIEQFLNEIVFRSLDKKGKMIFSKYEKFKYRKMFDPALLYEWYFKLKRPKEVDEKTWADRVEELRKTFGV